MIFATELKNELYSYKDLSLITGESHTEIAELLIINRLPESIKRECRVIELGRPIPKSTLLRIARKKGSDSEKIEELLRFEWRKGRPKAEVAKDKAQSLMKTLGSMKKDVIDGYEKERLDDELRGLKTSIDKVLS